MQSWLKDTILGLMFVVPAILSIKFFNRNFGVPVEVFMVWYYVGITVTILISTVATGGSVDKFVSPPFWVLAALFINGLVLGAGANLFTFSAYAHAPNTGVVQAIQEAAVPLIFFVTIFLSWLWPKYFATGGQVNIPWSVAGLVTTFAGVFMIIFKATK